MDSKVYVTVCTEITADGQMVPCSIEWEDGRLYPIDKVLDITQAAARRAGGARRPLYRPHWPYRYLPVL